MSCPLAGTGIRRYRRALARVVLLAALACPAAGLVLPAGCNMGPQPIPTPAVDPEKLVLEIHDEQLCVSGDPDAVQPPGALVEVVNLRTVDRAVVRARDDGSFGPACLTGRLGDVIRVTALDDEPSTGGGSASVDVEVRPAGSGAPAPDGRGGAAPPGAPDAGGTQGGGVTNVTAVPLVDPSLSCVRVAPGRVVLPVPSNTPTVAADAPVVRVENGCRFAVALQQVVARPPEGLGVRGAAPGVLAAGAHRELAVAARPTAAPASLDADATADSAAADAADSAEPGFWILEIHLALTDTTAAADEADETNAPAARDEIDVRRVLVVRCDDPTAAADAATCAPPRPPGDTVAPGAADALVASDAVGRDSAARVDASSGTVPRDAGAADVPSSPDAAPSADTRPDAGPVVVTPDALQAAGACRSDADREVLAALGDVHALALRCATGRCADAGRDCIITCIQQGDSAAELEPAPLLGRACAGCYADEALCVRETCKEACAPLQPADDLGCESCREEHCTPAFERCAGPLTNQPTASAEAAPP